MWSVHSRAVEALCRGAYSAQEVRTWVELLRPEGYLRPDLPRTVLVAERGHTLVGFGQLDAMLGELEALYVAPEEVGTGVGSRLLEALEALAWRAGARMMNLDASLNAETFYRSRGYLRLHAARRILTAEVQLSCVRMQKRRPALALGEGRGGGLLSPRPGP
ncbi:GNAT family N-acetyltransferase [Hyalangium rubrum]|uniref:GNAT family N-acetyltransferase n=1 Tax=Hyalangium rubrum TaxID=3103134 RepID=A0ABU5H6R4_9BACT|nr:GNAT family N-acetyltransferase [Hyalangium sp. s54d21]MDY7229163.1 GNAT family N-acetyltransferase [Hyalangium sp. s54d21]